MATHRARKKITGSLIAGALLVPLTAVAAAALIGSITNAQNAEATSVAPVTMAVEQLATTTAATPVSDADATITACTSGVEELLAAERDGTIDPLQTAALDALRQICEKEGLGVAGPPVPEPIVKVVTVNQTAPASGQSVNLECADDDDDNDDAYDDDAYDDDECDDDIDDHDDDDDDDDDDGDHNDNDGDLGDRDDDDDDDDHDDEDND